MKVGRNRVWAKMREMGLVLAAPHERDPDAPRGQVVTAESNRRWATDLTTVWTKHDGLVAVIPVIDCGDRVLLEAVRAWMHKYNHARATSGTQMANTGRGARSQDLRSHGNGCVRRTVEGFLKSESVVTNRGHYSPRSVRFPDAHRGERAAAAVRAFE